MSDSWIDVFLDKAEITYEVGPPRSTDSLGCVYRTLGLGGVKQEGEPFPLVAITVDFAKLYYQKDLLEFLNGDRHIVWRTKPQIEGGKLGQDRLSAFIVYSRLVSYPTRPKLGTSTF